MNTPKFKFERGDQVKVVNGVLDPDLELDTDISGWSGQIERRFISESERLYTIIWDHKTIDSMEDSHIEKCGHLNFNHTEMNLGEAELTPYTSQYNETSTDLRVATSIKGGSI